MFERLRAKDVEDFATELAREFSTRFKPGEPGGDTSASTLARAVDHLCSRAAQFQRARKLGIYGKAKLGTAFKLQLKESGYAEEFVNELTGKLLLSLSGK